MNTEQQRQLALDAFRMIFTTKAFNVPITGSNLTTDVGTYPGRGFVNGTLRGFDVSFLSARDGSVKNYRYLEQNPLKPSEPGRRAANGAQIMWAIDRDTNQFPFRVEAGQIIMSNKPAFVPVVQNRTASASVSLPSVEMLPEISEDMSEAVIRSLGEMDDYPGEGGFNEDYPDDELYK